MSLALSQYPHPFIEIINHFTPFLFVDIISFFIVGGDLIRGGDPLRDTLRDEDFFRGGDPLRDTLRDEDFFRGGDPLRDPLRDTLRDEDFFRGGDPLRDGYFLRGGDPLRVADPLLRNLINGSLRRCEYLIRPKSRAF
jgi:hypothetical protein